jgi:hypothetical protein
VPYLDEVATDMVLKPQSGKSVGGASFAVNFGWLPLKLKILHARWT